MKVLKVISLMLVATVALILSACQQSAPAAPAPLKADKPAVQAEKPAAPAAKPAEQPAKPAEAAKPAAPAAKPAAKAEPAKAPAKLSKVKVATIPIAYMVPAYAARDKGFFAAEGLEVEFENLAGGAAMIPAMEAGQFQFGESAVVPPILAKEQGLDIKMVLGNTRTPLKAPDDQPVMIRSDSPITNLKGLEGKKVAINTLYTTNWALLRESMRRQGGDPNKIQWVEMPFPTMPDALLNNQVDAVIAVEPSATLLLKGGKAKVLANYMVDVLPGLDNAVWIVSGKWAKDHQEETKAFVRGMTKGIEFVNANTDEKNRLIATFIKLPPELIKDLLIPPYESKINVPQLQKLADLLTQENVLKKQMNIKDVIWEGAPLQ